MSTKTIEIFEQKSFNLIGQLHSFALKAFIAHLKLQEYPTGTKNESKMPEYS